MSVRLTRVVGRLAVVAVLLPALAALGATTARPGSVVAAPPPNIVLIVTDDLDARALAQMPNVRHLIAQRGTDFSNFVVSTPGCCPSRASILRGQYTHNHGVFFSDPPDGGYEAFHNRGLERSTVATWLRAAGYRTALVGKYLNGYGQHRGTTHVPDGWQEWSASVDLNYFKYRMVENGRFVEYGSDPNDYLTDVLSRQARDFVRRAASDNQPFFLHLSPRAPHGPATPAPRHEGMFTHTLAPRGPSFNERDVGDKPSYVRNADRLRRAEVQKIDVLYRDRLRTLQAVDEMVEDLFATLKATGELDRTYVFFTSDNGFLLGEHRRTEKGVPYEEAIRVPLLVRGPGVRTGGEGRLASNIDLAPTFAQIAGARLPDFVDGRSLLPLLKGEQPDGWRQAALVASFGRNETDGGGERAAIAEVGTNPPANAFRALRLVDRVYVEYVNGERELYDLTKDPHQLQNLIESADKEDLDRLSAWLADLEGCGAEAATSCREAENSPPPTAAARPA